MNVITSLKRKSRKSDPDITDEFRVIIPWVLSFQAVADTSLESWSSVSLCTMAYESSIYSIHDVETHRIRS